MFEDLSTTDILSAIESSEHNGNLRDTQYGLWFQEKTYSPAGIITEAYKLKNHSINRRSFNTDIAQERLLKLGFPIVEIGIDFFTKKELESFSQLIQRPEYDSENIVDNNIGKFLNKVIWDKTLIWANGLKKLGWEVEGSKSWNEQDIKGQRYKKYTWYRIYPKNIRHNLLSFTVGAASNGSLVYKLDIKHNDPFFTENRIEFFRGERSARGILKLININEVKNHNWDSLTKKCHDFFLDHISDYEYFKNYFWPGEYRLMRLTWNANNWEFPSGHQWVKKNQGKSNIAYENQYGYGHEEWLLNDRYKVGNYQYGYIRGVEHMSEKVDVIDKVILFSIDPVSKNRLIIGEIKNVQIIEGDEIEINKVEPIYNKFIKQMVEELQEVNADDKHFIKEGFMPNVKFNWDDLIIHPEPISSIFLVSDSFKRYQPYRLDLGNEQSLKDEIEKASRLIFQPGKASSKSSYQKKTDSKTSTVTRKHTRITDDLYDYFLSIKGLTEDNISVEKTYVGGSCIDVAVKDDNQLVILEVKTSTVGLRNIRQALGQIFEYAFLDKNVLVKELIIVGPAKLNIEEKEYLMRLNKIIKIPLNYWYYDSSKELKERFINT